MFRLILPKESNLFDCCWWAYFGFVTLVWFLLPDYYLFVWFSRWAQNRRWNLISFVFPLLRFIIGLVVQVQTKYLADCLSVVKKLFKYIWFCFVINVTCIEYSWTFVLIWIMFNGILARYILAVGLLFRVNICLENINLYVIWICIT